MATKMKDNDDGDIDSENGIMKAGDHEVWDGEGGGDG